jgi:hypothetical protein
MEQWNALVTRLKKGTGCDSTTGYDTQTCQHHDHSRMMKMKRVQDWDQTTCRDLWSSNKDHAPIYYSVYCYSLLRDAKYEVIFVCFQGWITKSISLRQTRGRGLPIFQQEPLSQERSNRSIEGRTWVYANYFALQHLSMGCINYTNSNHQGAGQKRTRFNMSIMPCNKKQCKYNLVFIGLKWKTNTSLYY